MSQPPLLRFNGKLIDPPTRPHRLDGGIGPRAIIISMFSADEDHHTSEVAIEERLASGKLVTMLKRRRVDRPSIARSENELVRLKPNGQGVDLMARLHWPKHDAVLGPKDIQVGETLPIFGLEIHVDGPADEVTRMWLESEKLPGANMKPSIAAPWQLSAIKPPASPPTEAEPLPFFLGGPRPFQNASRGTPIMAEDDDCLVGRNAKLSAWPSLRGRPYQREQAMVPLPSQVAKFERVNAYGQQRVLFKAMVSPDGSTAAAPRSLLLSFFLADDTLQIVEYHSHEPGGSQFVRHANSDDGLERTTLLRRCRAPINRGRVSPSAGPRRSALVADGGGQYVELGDLCCGEALVIVGLKMRIVSCEPSSRRLLVEGGVAKRFGLRPSGGAWPGQDLEPWGFSVESE